MAPQQPRNQRSEKLAKKKEEHDKLDEKRAEYEAKKEGLLAKSYVVEAKVKTVLEAASKGKQALKRAVVQKQCEAEATRFELEAHQKQLRSFQSL